MLNQVNSTQSFGRSKDVACVNQARKTLGNIYQKYVANNLIKDDELGDVLLLNRVGADSEEEYAKLSEHNQELIDAFGMDFNKKTQDLASNKKICKMSLKQVQDLLKQAETQLKKCLAQQYEQLNKSAQKKEGINDITRKVFTPTEKAVLHQMKIHAQTDSLITIPQK